MPKVPAPQKGQPLDVDYVSSIVNAINEVYDTNAKNPNNNATIKGNSTTTANSAIWGFTESVTTPSSGSETSFTVTFNCKYAPIVVATLVNSAGTDAGKNVFVYIKNVTTTNATIVAKFNGTGVATVDVNVLVIGIPPQ